MHIEDHARLTPTKAAIVNAANGRVTSYHELDRKSIQLARTLQGCGLDAGDAVGVLQDSGAQLIELIWAAPRGGLRVVLLDPTLGPDQIAQRCTQAGVRAVIASAALTRATEGLADRLPRSTALLMTRGVSDGWQSLEAAQRAQSADPLPLGIAGELVFGDPHGRDRRIGWTGRVDGSDGAGSWPELEFMRGNDLDRESVLLSTAPLHHVATCAAVLAAHAAGATVVVMDEFDAQEALRLIERYHVTHGVWRSGMFRRLLELPEPIRHSYVLDSMRHALHEPGSLPDELSQPMSAWWGPLFVEYAAQPLLPVVPSPQTMPT